MIAMNVIGLTIDPQTQTPTVLLRETDGETVLPILLGSMEAMSVSMVLNRDRLPRPLGCDVLLACLKSLRSTLLSVEIVDFREGIFHALLVIPGPRGRERIDCRPSDALTLALRAGVPILLSPHVLGQLSTAAGATGKGNDSTACQRPDAAAEMVRKAEADRAMATLNSQLYHKGLFEYNSALSDEQRLKELLNTVEPITKERM